MTSKVDGVNLDSIINSFNKKYRGKNIMLFLYYFDDFTKSIPAFHILKDKIHHETGIVFSAQELHLIKYKLKNNPQILAEIERRNLEKEAKQKEEKPKVVDNYVKNPNIFPVQEKEKKPYRTMEELGLKFSDPNSKEFIEKHKRKLPFEMMDED